MPSDKFQVSLLFWIAFHVVEHFLDLVFITSFLGICIVFTVKLSDYLLQVKLIFPLGLSMLEKKLTIKIIHQAT